MKGTFKGKLEWKSSGARREISGGRVVWVGTWSGTFTNEKTGGFMDGTEWVCLGTTENKKGKTKKSNGFLTVTDGQDSEAWAEWTGHEMSEEGEIEGEAKWINGTGDWDKITGDVEYTGQADPDKPEGYVDVVGTYQTD